MPTRYVACDDVMGPQFLKGIAQYAQLALVKHIGEKETFLLVSLADWILKKARFCNTIDLDKINRKHLPTLSK